MFQSSSLKMFIKVIIAHSLKKIILWSLLSSMTFSCPPHNTTIFLPHQRQHSFLLGDYFGFYCCSSEKYIHVTATWFFSLQFLAILDLFFWETVSWGFAWWKFIGGWSQEQLILVIFLYIDIWSISSLFLQWVRYRCNFTFFKCLFSCSHTNL